MNQRLRAILAEVFRRVADRLDPREYYTLKVDIPGEPSRTFIDARPLEGGGKRG